MKSKILAIFLVLVIVVIIFVGPLSQKTQAVVVSSVIVGSVLAVMAMAGITVITSGMTAAELQQWVSDKLDEWAQSLGHPLDNLISAPGIGVTISGLLTVGTAAAQGICNFIDWLISDHSLTNNETKQIIYEPGLYLTDYFTIPASNDYVVFGNSISVLPGKSTQIHLTSINSIDLVEYDMRFSVNVANTSTYLCFNWNTDPVFSNLSGCTVSELTGIPFPTNVGGGLHVVFAPNHTQDLSFYLVSSQTELVASFSNLRINSSQVGSEDESLSIRTSTITVPRVTGQDKIFLDVGALPGSTVTEVSEGVIINTIAETLDVSGDVAEEEPAYVLTGPVPVYGLKDVFPFCIPFDLYDFVSCLAADPVAPHFEWRLFVEDVVDYTFVIDLQQFETAAQILRTMFLLAFIVGLAMVTRHLMRS